MFKSLTIFVSLVVLFLFQCDTSAQWVQTNGPNGGAKDVNVITVKGDTLFVLAEQGGVFFTTDDGVSWAESNKGLDLAPYTLAISGENMLVGGRNGMFISTNNSANWIRIDTEKPLSSVLAFGNDHNNLFAGTDSNGIFLSTDNGLSWVARRNGLPNITHETLNGMDTAYSSIDGFFIRDSEVFVISKEPRGAIKNGLFVSTNYGASWREDTTLTVSPPEFISAIDGNIFIGTEGEGLTRSTDNGIHWVIEDSGRLLNDGFFAITSIGKTIFAGTNYNVLRSTDSGVSWIAIDDGLTEFTIRSLFVKDSYLFAGTVSGDVWRRPLSEIAAVNENSSSPTQFSLSQNYPNPFDAATTVSYSLPEASRVTLKVYNAVGEEVATLVNEENAAGQHSVTFSAHDLQNGMYFYKLTTGKYSQTGKMVVVK